MKKETGMGFADQLPKPDPIPLGELNPRAGELQKYKEMFFDPRYDGFGPELEYLCNLPYHTSAQVESSKLGVGFEPLDQLLQSNGSALQRPGVSLGSLERAQRQPCPLSWQNRLSLHHALRLGTVLQLR